MKIEVSDYNYQKIYSYNFLSVLVIIITSTSFSFLVGSGFYGYGVDYYAAYHMPNLNWGGVYDRYGYAVSTLTIKGFHLGVHVVTFILSISLGFLLREFSKFKQDQSVIFFILLYLVSIHTWPIIMSTSNAMRQGLTMSLIFLVLISINRRNYFWMIFFSFFSIFMHKSGIFLITIIFFSVLINVLLAKFSFKSKLLINFILGVVLLMGAYYFLHSNNIYYNDGKPSKIINGDFRWAFVLISILYVSLSFLFKNLLNDPISIFLYYFSFISPAILMNGLNWEYERMGMMILIPYILSIGMLFNKASYKFYVITTFLLLLLLTIYMGMYASLI